MKVTDHIVSGTEAQRKASVLREQVTSLVNELIAILKPPSGTYAMPYHGVATSQRLEEISIITERLYANRITLMKANLVFDVVRRDGWPTEAPLPPAYAEIMNESTRLNQVVDLDFQSLLMFSACTLDDWARFIGHLLGVRNPQDCDFKRIVTDDGKGELEPLWRNHRGDILWLDAFTRLVRSKFLVHRSRPRSLGSTHSFVFMDWQYWNPVSEDWIGLPRLGHIESEMAAFEAKARIAPHSNRHERALNLLRSIDRFERDDRIRILKLADELGFMTPSFQEFVHRLLDFLGAATSTVAGVVRADPSSIKLGRGTA